MAGRRYLTFAIVGAALALTVTAGTFLDDARVGVSGADLAIDIGVMAAIGAGVGLAVEQIAFWLRPRKR